MRVLERLRSIEKQKRIIKARTNPNDFIEYVIKDTKTQKAVIQGQVHRDLQTVFTNHKKVIIGLPRFHGKTVQIIGRALFEIGKNPDIIIKIIGPDETSANRRVETIKSYIENSKEYHEVFPNVKSKKGSWGKTSITVQRDVDSSDPTIEGKGIFSTGTGGRSQLTILDDICSMENTLTNPAQRPKVYDNLTNVWLNQIHSDDNVWWVHTPWHTQDATSLYKKVGKYHIFERYVSADFTPVWPEYWTKEDLKNKLEIDLNNNIRAFDRGYRGKAMSDEEKVFKNLEQIRDYELSADDVEAMDGIVCAGVDLALSKKDNAAYTVIFIMKMDEKGNKAPLFILRKKIGSVATAAWILALYGRYNIDTYVVENNAYQSSLIEWIDILHSTFKNYMRVEIKKAEKSETVFKKQKKDKIIYHIDNDSLDKFYRNSLSADINSVEWDFMKKHLHKAILKDPYIISFRTGSNKADELIGIPGFAGDIANKWVIPSKGCNLGCDCNFCAWFAEMDDYPIAATKDIVMASWFANRGLDSFDFEVRSLITEKD